MVSTALAPASSPTASPPFSEDEVRRRIDGCPKLASLKSINRALAGLVNSDHSYNAQIAEIIRRDPSLTARLLRMVNSVYFGLTAKVNNIEEAVFYLGLRQIRELSMATPVIEELGRMSTLPARVPWRDLWKHSIGTAIMTREILATTSLLVDDDTDYIVGLLHNVGKVVLATAFPDQFNRIVERSFASTAEVCAYERELIGLDHAEMGGIYLERHQLSPEIVAAVRHHHHPEAAGPHALFAAAVQVADLLVRHAGIPGGLERVGAVADHAWTETAGWAMLYGGNERETRMAEAALAASLRRLPVLLNGLV